MKINVQFFANHYDLSADLEGEKSTITIGEDIYELNDGFNDFIKIDKFFNEREGKFSVSDFKQFFDISLGKDQSDKLLGKNYGLKFLRKVVTAISENLKGDDKEEVSGA